MHHPLRRRMYELLTIEGPAPVGMIASALEVAPGSVSHHAKLLHAAGLIEPAPELAHDTRESWWRGIRRSLSWTVDDYAPGTAAREVVELAELANLRYQQEATLRWLRNRAQLPGEWSASDFATDDFVPATVSQVNELRNRIAAVQREWDAEVRADTIAHPDADRMPIRFIARGFPKRPGESL